MAKQDYTEKEIATGLAAYALCSGRGNRTTELLKKQGLKIPINTIRYWAYNSHKDQYEHIKVEVDDHVRSQLADVHLSLAHTAADIEQKAIDGLDALLAKGDLDAKDLATILKNAAIAAGVHTDKAQVLAGKPTAIVQNDFDDLQRALKQRGVSLVIGAGDPSQPPAPTVPEDRRLPAATP